MPPKQSFWFRLGYALERARHGPPTAGRSLASRSLKGLAERQAKSLNAEGESDPALAWPSIDDIVASGATAAVAKVLSGWKPRRKTPTLRLLRAGAAGAAAALMVDVLRPLLRGESGVGPLDRETGDRLLAGIGQGLVYGAVVEQFVNWGFVTLIVAPTTARDGSGSLLFQYRPYRSGGTQTAIDYLQSAHQRRERP